MQGDDGDTDIRDWTYAHGGAKRRRSLRRERTKFSRWLSRVATGLMNLLRASRMPSPNGLVP